MARIIEIFRKRIHYIIPKVKEVKIDWNPEQFGTWVK